MTVRWLHWLYTQTKRKQLVCITLPLIRMASSLEACWRLPGRIWRQILLDLAWPCENCRWNSLKLPSRRIRGQRKSGLEAKKNYCIPWRLKNSERNGKYGAFNVMHHPMLLTSGGHRFASVRFRVLLKRVCAESANRVLFSENTRFCTKLFCMSNTCVYTSSPLMDYGARLAYVAWHFLSRCTRRASRMILARASIGHLSHWML